MTPADPAPPGMVTFDCAYPDGLLATQGHPFEHAGQQFVIHHPRTPDMTPARGWMVSHRESGFGIGSTLVDVIGHTPEEAKEKAIAFMTQFSDKTLAVFGAAAMKRRPKRRIDR